MTRFYSAPPPSNIMETGSKYHNRKYRKGVQEVLKKRARDDMLNRVGELVEEHGVETLRTTTLLKNGRKRTRWDDI